MGHSIACLHMNNSNCMCDLLCECKVGRESNLISSMDSVQSIQSYLFFISFFVSRLGFRRDIGWLADAFYIGSIWLAMSSIWFHWHVRWIFYISNSAMYLVLFCLFILFHFFWEGFRLVDVILSLECRQRDLDVWKKTHEKINKWIWRDV